MKRLIFLTGRPGVGKTTVLIRAVEKLKESGYIPGGMISRELRDKGSRIGFEIINLKTQAKGWLAHINQPSGPKIGKYRVNLKDLEQIGAKSIIEAIETADFIVIDEIGPMELYSRAFVNAVFQALHSNKLIVGTIHWRARGKLIETVRKSVESEIIEVNPQNREHLCAVVVEKCLNFLKA